jgi:plastocyanin
LKLLALSVLVAALAVPAAATGASTANTLTATVGPGFTITLTQGGKTVKKLRAGTYTIKVKDVATDHNFHLKGPGIDKKTSTPAKVTTTWKLKLRAGKYTYVCDPHKSFMKGAFTVS